MKVITLFILFTYALSSSCQAATLKFAPKIQQESLAEEAILLLQCLAERSGENWELSQEDFGSHWLKLVERENQTQANGTYFREGKSININLKTGGAGKICDDIYPSEQKQEPTPATWPTETQLPVDNTVKSKSPTVLWIIGAIALSASGGYLYWKSRQPDHQGLRME